MTEQDERELQYQRDCGAPTKVLLPSDLDYAMREHPEARPSSDIVEVLAVIEGANDGPNWHWLLALEHNFTYITGGCDYTGWGCQSGAEKFEAPTLTECLALVGEAERGDFERQLRADQNVRHLSDDDLQSLFERVEREIVRRAQEQMERGFPGAS